MGWLRAEYDQVSPDGPEHFPVVYAKTLRMRRTEPNLDLASLAAVTAPTLVLQGDHDEVTFEHSVAVAAALPTGSWPSSRAPMPCPRRTPRRVNALLLWFLAGTTPVVDWPTTGPGR